MRFLRYVLVLALGCSSAPPPQPQPQPQPPSSTPSPRPQTPPAAASIGSATMKPDGTILLQLRAEGSGGMVGDALIVIGPSDPKHADTLRHLGGLRPGESKPVPPWPDPQPSQ